MDNQLDLATLEQIGSHSKKVMRTAIEAAGYLASQGDDKPLLLLIEQAKITHPELLTEQPIVKIIKKYTGNLGKLITGIKNIGVKKIIKVATP